MSSIKEFLESRTVCPLCEDDLEIKLTCFALKSKIDVSLKENILQVKSNFFDYDLNIINNIVSKGKDNSHWEFHLSLFCPFHTNLESENYEYDLIFDVYNGKIANESPHEVLRTDSFILTSFPYLNRLDYTNRKTGTYTTLPYFDYSKMSLSKLKDKLKTYLLIS